MRAKTFLLSLAAVLLLAACASSNRAPVESRTGARAPADAAPLVARPGHHIVKRGETLYSIALEYGQDYREVASWNGLENPNVILVGQELRVVPPEGTVARPVLAPGVEVRPPAGAPVSRPAASVPAGTDPGIRQEPRGGRIAYSPQAWKDLQQGPTETRPPTASASVVSSAPVAAASAPAAASRPVEKAVPAPVEARSDEDLDWMWPGSGRVIASFNEATNKGIDLAGGIGDPVVAAASGRVVYAGSGLPRYGKLVIVKHNNTYLSVYAHNHEILVKEGQTVQKGQKIATLGSSDSDKPKLHFEIRKQGRPVDPARFLPQR